MEIESTTSIESLLQEALNRMKSSRNKPPINTNLIKLVNEINLVLAAANCSSSDDDSNSNCMRSRERFSPRRLSFLTENNNNLLISQQKRDVSISPQSPINQQHLLQQQVIQNQMQQKRLSHSSPFSPTLSFSLNKKASTPSFSSQTLTHLSLNNNNCSIVVNNLFDKASSEISSPRKLQQLPQKQFPTQQQQPQLASTQSFLPGSPLLGNSASFLQNQCASSYATLPHLKADIYNNCINSCNFNTGNNNSSNHYGRGGNEENQSMLPTFSPSFIPLPTQYLNDTRGYSNKNINNSNSYNCANYNYNNSSNNNGHFCNGHKTLFNSNTRSCSVTHDNNQDGFGSTGVFPSDQNGSENFSRSINGNNFGASLRGGNSTVDFGSLSLNNLNSGSSSNLSASARFKNVSSSASASANSSAKYGLVDGKVISARLCIICGLEKPGEIRKSGFKCFDCIGIPSTKGSRRNRTIVEELTYAHKGKDEILGLTTINDYVFIGLLGKGSYGKVKLAQHLRSEQAYAIKVLNKSKLLRTVVQSKFNAINFIEREVELMKNLNHPCIIKIFSVIDDPGEDKLYIVMEYLSGGQIYHIETPKDDSDDSGSESEGEDEEEEGGEGEGIKGKDSGGERREGDKEACNTSVGTAVKVNGTDEEAGYWGNNNAKEAEAGENKKVKTGDFIGLEGPEKGGFGKECDGLDSRQEKGIINSLGSGYGGRRQVGGWKSKEKNRRYHAITNAKSRSRPKPIEFERLRKFITSIALGLEYLHNNSIVHRDIKLENILLDNHDNAKLTDFGMSSFCDEDDMMNISAGSPAYWAPEVFTHNGNSSISSNDGNSIKGGGYGTEGFGGNGDNSASLNGNDTFANDIHNGFAQDVWAFGVAVYAMATGELPFYAKKNLKKLKRKVFKADPEYPPELVSEHPELVDLIKRMLNKDPVKRITITEVLSHPLIFAIRTVKGFPIECTETKIRLLTLPCFPGAFSSSSNLPISSPKSLKSPRSPKSLKSLNLSASLRTPSCRPQSALDALSNPTLSPIFTLKDNDLMGDDLTGRALMEKGDTCFFYIPPIEDNNYFDINNKNASNDLNANGNSNSSSIKDTSSINSNNKARRILQNFFEQEGPDFQVMPGGSYSLVIYSVKSDPRRKKAKLGLSEINK